MARAVWVVYLALFLASVLCATVTAAVVGYALPDKGTSDDTKFVEAARAAAVTTVWSVGVTAAALAVSGGVSFLISRH